MTPTTDKEFFGERLGEDDLLRIVREQRGDELDALKELIRRRKGKGDDRMLEIFRSVLTGPGYGGASKKTVVAALGAQASPDNEALLLQQLDTRDASLFAAVAAALGRIGGEKVLERLEAVQAPADAAAIHALEFARALIAYRLQLPKHLLASPAENDVVPVDDGFELRASNADPQTVDEALRDVQLPALPLAREGAARFDCRDTTTLLLVFTGAFSDLTSFERLGQRNGIVLVMLKKGLSLERYALDQYLFFRAHDGSDDIELLGTRPQGQRTFAGKIRRTGGIFEFTIRSLDSRYVPAIDVRGRFDPKRRSWSFDKAVSSAQLAARTPAARPVKVARSSATGVHGDTGEIIRRAMAFPIEKVLFRYRKEHGLSEQVARHHERELKRFLALVAISDKGYGMRGPIDALWHTFILFTKIYARFCREVAGRFIHHFPNISGFEPAAGAKESDPLDKGPEAYLRFLKDYEATFGEPAPQAVWPRPAGREIGVYAAAECASDDCGNTCGADTGGTGGGD